MNNILVFFFCFLLGLCVAFRQEITLYAEENQEGDAVIIRNKQPDLRPHLAVLNGTWKSICYRGTHYGYYDLNYAGIYEHTSIAWSDTLVCENDAHSGLQSLRHLGPDESTVPSISLYENNAWSGAEIVIEGAAFTNVRFTPHSLFTTGWSNWTLYSQNNFAGNASCYTSTAEVHSVSTLDSTFIIGSVRRGCPTNRRIDNVITAADLDITQNE